VGIFGWNEIREKLLDRKTRVCYTQHISRAQNEIAQSVSGVTTRIKEKLAKSSGNTGQEGNTGSKSGDVFLAFFYGRYDRERR